MNEKKKLITTDFDGTLTTHDTLLLFIQYAKGTKAFYKGFIAHLWLLVLMKLGWKSNEKVKEQLFSYYFKGTHITAYGDSSGDSEMLKYADVQYYKPFRTQ